MAFSLAGSAFCRYSGLSPGFIAPVASLLTILMGVYAIFGAKLWTLWPVLLLGATSELVGLYSGFPFGRYEYTDRWIPTVALPLGHRFPLILPFAWLLMAGSAWAISPFTGWKRALFGGLVAALVDLPMEAVMTGRLGYWRWLPPGPLPGGASGLNFIGWFLVASVAGLLLERVQGADRKSAGWVLGGFGVLVAGLALLG